MKPKAKGKISITGIALFMIALCVIAILLCTTGCTESQSYKDTQRTREAANTLQGNQPTPTDIDYSLERYNLIRRAYWVNGQEDKARALVCEVNKPLGYIYLFAGNRIIGQFTVDGKVSSLNSFLTPDNTYPNSTDSRWLADVDGSYGENDFGVFWFTVEGNYGEWTGDYFYTDKYMELNEAEDFLLQEAIGR